MQLPTLAVVTSPSPLITTADAKAHLRIDTSDDDALIDGLIAAATQVVDGATGWLGRALGQQTLALTAPTFPGWSGEVDWRFGSTAWPICHAQEIRLPCPPIQSVASIAYTTPAGLAVVLDPAFYALNDRILFPLGGAAWPDAAFQPGSVTVTYVAGYPAGQLPAPIRAAILLMVGELYANRNDAPATFGLVSERLLLPFRVFA